VLGAKFGLTFFMPSVLTLDSNILEFDPALLMQCGIGILIMAWGDGLWATLGKDLATIPIPFWQ
jgi:dolichol kinase